MGLGVLAFAALAYAFLPGMFSSGTTTKVTVSTPSPKSSASPSKELTEVKMPTREEQLFDYVSTPIDYRPGDFGAPAPRRNIFAFYEPPPPTPWVEPPVVTRTPVPPTPTPTPPYLIAFVMPQNIYAGSRGFRLEVNGDKFTPDAKIYFSQSLMPTNFVSAQKLTADIPANFIAGEGGKQIIVQSLDGTKYSLPVMLNVQPQPKPQMLYIGMVSRKYGNNDTAYFVESNRINTPGTVPQSKRLNDVLEGRFKLVSIATNRVVVEDVNLGFRHGINLYAPTSTGGSGTGAPTGFPAGGGFPTRVQPGSVPGFPGVTMPQPRPPNNANRPVRDPQKADADDDDDPK